MSFDVQILQTEVTVPQEQIVVLEVPQEQTVVLEVTQAQQGLPGPPGPQGTGSGDMQKLIYDPHGFETDVFDLGRMAGTLDAGTF
jgi:hypothetical protein